MKTAYWAVLAFVVFSLAFFAWKYASPTRAYFLEGMRIESDAELGPKEGLAAILSRQPQIVRMEMYNGSDTRNSIVIAIASEAIASLAYNNKTVASYALVFDQNDSSKQPGLLGCNENNSQCAPPTITVRYGGCNCLRILSKQGLLEAEGDEGFLGDNTIKLRGIIGLVLSDLPKERNATASASPESR